MADSLLTRLKNAIFPTQKSYATANDGAPLPSREQGRGYQVVTSQDIVNISARDKKQAAHTVPVEFRWTQLDPLVSLQIMQRCPPVFAVITARANRVASTDWHVIPAGKTEQIKVERMKMAKQIFEENLGRGMVGIGRCIKALQFIRRTLNDVHADLSNFDAALYRWQKSLDMYQEARCDEVYEFFSHPAPGKLWADFMKESVTDLLCHGRLAWYKQQVLGKVRNLYTLPGGTVVPIRGKFVGQLHGYVQLADSFSEPAQLFFQDEISFGWYMPNSATAYGMTPIDALINLCAENMLFSEFMAQAADGTRPPDKAVVFGDKTPGTVADGFGDFTDPLDKGEQKRLEESLNRMKKESGIRVLTGYGTPIVLDLSRADTIPTQLARQDQINKYVAMVFNSSMLEINETGGDGTSGRSTSETQERMDNTKGTRPIFELLQDMMNMEVLPYSEFGPGYELEFEIPMSEKEKIEVAKLKKDSGLFSVDEIRKSDYNADPFGGEYSKPQGANPQQQAQETMDKIQESLQRR